MKFSRHHFVSFICRLLLSVPLCCGVSSSRAQGDFVNFETPPVHSLDLSPDGARLAMAHGADGRVEIFKFQGDGKPVAELSVAVGIDPVSVRWRSATELWVVNHVSDSVNIVDVATRQIIATLTTEDKPCDVVFAGSPQRAFVSCSVGDVVLVYDPANRTAAPQRVPIPGEDPRALAVSPDGLKVYAAIFESGNSSTLLGGGSEGTAIDFPPNAVSDARGPYGGVNPPPNQRANFFPAKNPSVGTPPKVGLIVKKNATGAWMDDNAHDWTPLVSGPLAAASGRPVGWDLIDNDVAIIDTATLSLSFATRMMNLCMSLAVNPVSGKVTVVGTEATNEVRFEPVVNSTFVRVKAASFEGATPTQKTILDLNPHLNYAVTSIPQAGRDLSLGDPRAIVWRASGTRAYVAGMGSNNLIALDASGARIPGNPIPTGQGPCGLAVDEARGQLYVYNRFEGSLSVISLSTETEISRVSFFDPTPAAIKAGRPFLYDTHRTSGLGQVSCASCHPDARMDRLAWDLGDPSGGIKAVSGTVHNLGAGIPGLTGGFTNFRPMKGPMTTQTMQDIIGKEPLHWRGDRNGIEEFNGAFVSLLGGDVMLSLAEMAQFKAFLASIYFPPNPYRNPDNTLSQNLPLPGHYTSGRFSPAGRPLPNGNAKRGLDTLYRPVSRQIDSGAFACVTCHTVPIGIGTNTMFNGSTFLPISPGPNGEKHHALVSIDGSTQKSLKVPQLRNMYDKVGFEMTQPLSRAGFGFAHDGAVDSLSRFFSEGAFTTTNDQEIADLVALLLSFTGSEFGSPVDGAEPPGTSSQDTHAAVGRQALLTGPAQPAAGAALLNQLVTLASAGKIDLVAHAAVNGLARGWFLIPAGWQSDEKTVVETLPALLARATAAGPVCFTAVVKGTGRRLGIDRDRDGLLDYDEARDLALNVPGIQNPFRPDAFDGLGNSGASGSDGTADGQNDFDGDGVSNEAEFAAGTNPAQQLAVDVPMHLKMVRTGTPFTIALTWQTAPYGQYEVSWSADLMQWTPLATGLVDAPAGGGAYSWTDAGLPATPGPPSAAGKRFYRVNRIK